MTTQSGKHFSLQKDQDGCLHIRWNSPALLAKGSGLGSSQPNQMCLESLAELSDILREIQSLPKPPLVMFGSGNSRGFGTGLPPQELIRIRQEGQIPQLLSLLKTCCTKLANLPCPVIAAVSGICTGPALELALWCDYRVIFDSPKTRLGFLGGRLDWFPLPETICRTSHLAGIERAFRLAAGNQTLSPSDAWKWGLADAIPASEPALKKALIQFRGIALGTGKKIPSHPRNLVRRLLQATPWSRSVVKKGLLHWLDRKLPAGCPWQKGLKSLLNQVASHNQITDQPSLDHLWFESANSLQALDSWRIQLATIGLGNTQPSPSKIVRLGIHTLDWITTPWITRALSKGVTVVVLRQSLGSNTTNSKWLENINKKAPGAILLTEFESELGTCDISLFSDSTTQAPEKSNPAESAGIFVNTSELKSPDNFARLYSSSPLTTRTWGSLVGPNRATGIIREKLVYLGVSCTHKESTQESWHLAYPPLWVATLECLALGMDPTALESAAIQSGWGQGPCQTMQEWDLATVARWLLVGFPSNSDHPPNRLVEAFNTWSGKFLANQGNLFAWVRGNRLGQLQSTGLHKGWKKSAGLESDPLLEALPQTSKHLEGINRLEGVLCRSLAKMPSAAKVETVLVVWREQLGFPGWKIRKLLTEAPDNFSEVLEELGFSPR